MRNSRLGAFMSVGALAAVSVLGGAGIAQAAENSTITGGAATVTATTDGECGLTFKFNDGPTEDQLTKTNWVVDYRIGDEAPSIPSWVDEDETEFDDVLSVFRPVVASNAPTADALTEKYDYDVGVLENTVNLNGIVEANESGEHEVTFKFYRGAADWSADSNKGAITVTGCETISDGDGGDNTDDEGTLIDTIIGSVDVFGSLGSSAS